MTFLNWATPNRELKKAPRCAMLKGRKAPGRTLHAIRCRHHRRGPCRRDLCPPPRAAESRAENSAARRAGRGTQEALRRSARARRAEDARALRPCTAQKRACRSADLRGGDNGPAHAPRALLPALLSQYGPLRLRPLARFARAADGRDRAGALHGRVENGRGLRPHRADGGGRAVVHLLLPHRRGRRAVHRARDLFRPAHLPIYVAAAVVPRDGQGFPLLFLHL